MLRCSAGLGFRVQLLVCSAALLGQRPEWRLRRGATPRVEIHWLQWPWDSLYKKVCRETKFRSERNALLGWLLGNLVLWL